MTDPDTNKPLYDKYEVKRRDGDPTGKHVDCFYYVLDLEHDLFALPALYAYALACQHEYPQLAADLFLRIDRDIGLDQARALHEELLRGLVEDEVRTIYEE